MSSLSTTQGGTRLYLSDWTEGIVSLEPATLNMDEGSSISSAVFRRHLNGNIAALDDSTVAVCEWPVREPRSGPLLRYAPARSTYRDCEFPVVGVVDLKSKRRLFGMGNRSGDPDSSVVCLEVVSRSCCRQGERAGGCRLPLVVAGYSAGSWVSVWDPETGRHVVRLPCGPERVVCMEYVREWNDALFVGAGETREAEDEFFAQYDLRRGTLVGEYRHYWNAPEMEYSRKHIEPWIEDFASDPRRGLLFTVDGEYWFPRMVLWAPSQSRKPVGHAKIPHSVRSVTFVEGKNLLLCGTERPLTIQMWDPRRLEESIGHASLLSAVRNGVKEMVRVSDRVFAWMTFGSDVGLVDVVKRKVSVTRKVLDVRGMCRVGQLLQDDPGVVWMGEFEEERFRYLLEMMMLVHRGETTPDVFAFVMLDGRKAEVVALLRSFRH